MIRELALIGGTIIATPLLPLLWIAECINSARNGDAEPVIHKKEVVHTYADGSMACEVIMWMDDPPVLPITAHLRRAVNSLMGI